MSSFLLYPIKSYIFELSCKILYFRTHFFKILYSSLVIPLSKDLSLKTFKCHHCCIFVSIKYLVIVAYVLRCHHYEFLIECTIIVISLHNGEMSMRETKNVGTLETFSEYLLFR